MVKRREQFDFYFVSEPCFVTKGWDVGGVLGDQYFKETGTNSQILFLLQQELITYCISIGQNLGTDTISGPSVTECKMLKKKKIRTVLHLIC